MALTPTFIIAVCYDMFTFDSIHENNQLRLLQSPPLEDLDFKSCYIAVRQQAIPRDAQLALESIVPLSRSLGITIDSGPSCVFSSLLA